MDDKANTSEQDCQAYEPPRVTELGSVSALTLAIKRQSGTDAFTGKS